MVLGLFSELVTMDRIRNFLNEMVTVGVISFYSNIETQWRKMYYLTPEFETAFALDSFATAILSFCR